MRFRQVLTNLMGNAPKFTESGEIELSLDAEEETDHRIKLHAKIRDTGIGIAKDSLRSIFHPFQQADGSTSRKYGGTGLGLSISRQIANLLDGDVWAESEENKGSTFHFSAWLEKVDDMPVEKYSPVSLSGKRALIIDDNRNNLEILTHHLKQFGMDVIALNSGHTVMSTLQKEGRNNNPVDICICDIQMPDMTGYDVAKEIRTTQSPFKNLPLIALSSLMGRDAKTCKKAGFSGFLSKPARRERLYQLLERVLGEKESEGDEGNAKASGIITQYSVREQVKHSISILLAEDNPVNQKLAKIMLCKAGYQVDVATNGREAVEKLTASPQDYSLVFMDVQMPEMTGIEATQAIRTKGFDSIPIIAMTAQAMEGDEKKCLRAGMDDYITKPIKRQIVFKMIEKWVLEKGQHPY